MARVRSPNFPYLSLREAIEKARVIFDRENKIPASRDTLARHLGYNGLNGASAKTLSALGKYGLLEDAPNDQEKLSSLALDILHGSDEERAAAIKTAARMPALFVKFEEQFGGRPSEANLKSYLLRNGFSASAVDTVISSYFDTLDLVAECDAQYSPSNVDRHLEVRAGPIVVRNQSGEMVTGFAAPATPSAPVPMAEPFSVQFVPGGVRINADIRDQQTLTELVNALQALSGFLQKTKAQDAPPESTREDPH